MAISNRILAKFDYEKIDLNYDFYIVTTSDKYINSGARILDKAILNLKAESVVFDNGKSIYVMFKKGKIDEYAFSNVLEDSKLKVNKVNSSYVKKYILFRLFIYSINNFNFEANKFNNITGKLFITNPSWISKNQKTFTALSINMNQEMLLSCEATTFSKSMLFKKNVIQHLPLYSFANKNCSLKRVFDVATDECYVKKAIYGKKASLCYFDFSSKDLSSNKVFYMYKVLEFVYEKFRGLVEFDMNEIEIRSSITNYRDSDFDDKSLVCIKNKRINLINWSSASEYKNDFDNIYEMLIEKGFEVKTSNSIDSNDLNLIYLHNKEYYEHNGYNDPYTNFKQSSIIQHFTIEDSSDKIINDNKTIFNTIVKELAIKNDIINQKKITIDDWESYHFNSDYIFGKEKNNIQYFMVISPNGEMIFYHKSINFKPFLDPRCEKMSKVLTQSEEQDKTIVSDSDGNILMISRTEMFTIPSKELFGMDYISRSKESRNKYFSGVLDINLFNVDGQEYYNAGIKGSGMNTKIIKAPILYKINVIEGKSFFEDILKTMSVPFVKYNSFTVMPYPFKYLNEYINMCEIEQIKN